MTTDQLAQALAAKVGVGHSDPQAEPDATSERPDGVHVVDAKTGDTIQAEPDIGQGAREESAPHTDSLTDALLGLLGLSH